MPTSKRSSTRRCTAESGNGRPTCPASHAAIADIPLLFETGHTHDFDKIIVCACEPEEQVRRLITRDRLSAEDARARLAAQWPIEEKVARADYVIRTDGTYADTDRQVARVYESLTSL